MHKVKLYVAVAMVFISSPCLAQESEFADADSFDSAVRLMKLSLHGLGYMETRCTTSFPKLKGEIESHIAKYKARERHAIRVAEARWAEMYKQMPQVLDASLAAVEVAVDGSLALADNDTLRRVCGGYFAQYSSGVWRQRTPRVYEYLDQAPE